MPKYLFEVADTAAGAKGLASDGGSKRRAAFAKLVEGLGAKLEALYYISGDIDLYAIVEAPDDITAAAISLVVNEGDGASIKTVELI